MRWARGVTTVVGLELRQRVRSRRWWVSLVAWSVLIGAFTLLMRANGTDMTSSSEPLCDAAIIVTDDGTTVDGCALPSDTDYSGLSTTASSPDRAVYAQGVCTAGDDGTVRCTVMSWSTFGGVTCYDTGSGTACSQYDTQGALVTGVEGPPPPPLGFECTSTADGSAVCPIPAATSSTGEMMAPPQTCTISYHPGHGTGSDYRASCTWDPVDGWRPSSGPTVFGLVVFFVLGLGLLVTPALTAGSINGDRQAGTLATLQATTLSATQIALGKLVAAWLTMLAFLVAALPWIFTAMVVAGTSLVQVLGCCALVMLELAVMCAVGLGWSALFNRTSGSNLLSYGTALLLSVLTVVFTILLAPLTTHSTQVDVYRLPDDVQARWDAEMDAFYNDPSAFLPPAMPVDECAWITETRSETHTEEAWWLLVPNPFVMVADAAPAPTIAQTHPQMYETWGGDPLFATRGAVSALAAGPQLRVVECTGYDLTTGMDVSPLDPVQVGDSAQFRVWPWSLAANLLLGGTFFVITVRRLKVPYRKLPRGTRVA